MNPVVAVGKLLAERFGLSLELIRDGTIERALQTALGQTLSGTDRAEAMARLLRGEGDAWQMLVEEVLVPETWFLRDTEPFRLLASFTRAEWLPANPSRRFKVLCIPCASGEEPYSVAVALLDAGLEPRRILIDAGDASERSLARARVGVYGRMSFREKSPGSLDRYLVRCPEGLRVRDDVRQLVSFDNVNLLDLCLYRSRAPYDAIFCRNALIYLEERARQKILLALRDLLHENGLLFTGHTELLRFLDAGYEAVDHPRSFACRLRRTTPHEPASTGPAATLPAPAQLRPTAKRTRAGAANIATAGTAAHARQPLPSLEQAERLADRGELEAAKAICDRLLAEGARDPDIYSLLGVMSELGGEAEGADDFFRKALYLDPHHYIALLHMSLLCEGRGDVEGSRRFRARAGRALSRQEGNQVRKSL